MAIGNILIFAGAGASKAVASDSYPTTVQFFDSLPDSIRQNPLFSVVVEYLRKNDKAAALDIELILWRLQELQGFCAQATDQSQLVGWMLAGNRLNGIMKQQLHHADQIVSLAGVARSQLDKLIG